MALPPVPVPQYPNVPVAPGVPPVQRNPFSVPNSIALLVSDAAQIVRMFQGPSWGIFSSSGAAILTGDTTIGFDFRHEYRVSNYPQEAGAFGSYDKVQTPYDGRLTIVCGGAFSINAITSAISATSLTGALNALTGESARAAFLNTLETIAASLDLYNIVTPEKTYTSANVVNYDYRRTAQDGATLLTADIWLEEIRIAPAPKFTNTATPSGANAVNGGTVQAAPPSPDQPQGAVSPSQPPPSPGPEATNQPPPNQPASDSTSPSPPPSDRPPAAERDANYNKAQADPGYQSGDRIDDYGRNTSQMARDHTLVIGQSNSRALLTQ